MKNSNSPFPFVQYARTKLYHLNIQYICIQIYLRHIQIYLSGQAWLTPHPSANRVAQSATRYLQPGYKNVG